jgi:uncharacterized protein YndB with AHSA1/START domain
MHESIVHASMLIRRPPGEVFAAFVNPQILRKFWLRDASGPLAPGARVEWHFMAAGTSAKVVVTSFESPRRIGFTWDGETQVELTFEPFPDGATRLAAAINGLDPKEWVVQATNVVEGFTIVFCDLKTLLERGESANLVRDKAALTESGRPLESAVAEARGRLLRSVT